MKKTAIFGGLLVATLPLLVSFTKKSAKELYQIDTQKSSITWVGRKVSGEHKGNIKLLSGSLSLQDNKLNGGSFGVDMNSITCTDLEGEWNQKLIGHLKNDDFFSVEKYPKATFEIIRVTETGANKVNVTGKLSIKGITNTVSFPATVKKNGQAVVAIAEGVKVDRTKYNIKYGSKSFFSDLGDKVIEDDFELSIMVVATK